MITATPPKEQRGTTTGLYRGIAVVFFALAAAIAIFSAYVVFSRAEIVVLSDQEETEGDFIIDITMQATEGEVNGGVYEISKKVSQAFPATSVVTIDLRAEGRVRITSSLSRSQTLVATTRLLTPDGLLFRIDKTVAVPAFGSASVDIYADEPGEGGAIGDATFTIPGLNPGTRQHFTVETIDPLVSGQREVRMVTATDIIKAEELLEERLRAELSDVMREKAREDGVPRTGELFRFETTRQESDVAAGEEADEFRMNVAVIGSGVFFDRDELRGQVRQLLEDRLSYDRSLLHLNEADLLMEVEKCDLLGRRANIRVVAAGTAILSDDAHGLDPDKITGVTIDAAKEYLESLDGVSSASVKLKPFWSRRLPNVADHIEVEVR
ncbi:MAG: hypothetical protein U9Q03_00840 [Patescibacteria group bacterium]|nr:hypothetical protein [Patescibacteria group bacterium]